MAKNKSRAYTHYCQVFPRWIYGFTSKGPTHLLGISTIRARRAVHTVPVERGAADIYSLDHSSNGEATGRDGVGEKGTIADGPYSSDSHSSADIWAARVEAFGEKNINLQGTPEYAFSPRSTTHHPECQKLKGDLQVNQTFDHSKTRLLHTLLECFPSHLLSCPQKHRR